LIKEVIHTDINSLNNFVIFEKSDDTKLFDVKILKNNFVTLESQMIDLIATGYEMCIPFTLTNPNEKISGLRSYIVGFRRPL